MEIALECAVEGTVVMSRQRATLLENAHGSWKVYLGPARWWWNVFNYLDAVLKGGPVTMVISVRTLEPADEIAVVEIET